MKKVWTVLAVISAISMIVTLLYGSWMIGRKINYAIGYESTVRDTIKEMVRPEALK